jgi:hypothetical protein
VRSIAADGSLDALEQPLPVNLATATNSGERKQQIARELR